MSEAFSKIGPSSCSFTTFLEDELHFSLHLSNISSIKPRIVIELDLLTFNATVLVLAILLKQWTTFGNKNDCSLTKK